MPSCPKPHDIGWYDQTWQGFLLARRANIRFVVSAVLLAAEGP